MARISLSCGPQPTKSYAAWPRNISEANALVIPLQPTALLHEAFLRVLKRPDQYWRSEMHVVAFAARAE